MADEKKPQAQQPSESKPDQGEKTVTRAPNNKMVGGPGYKTK